MQVIEQLYTHFKNTPLISTDSRRIEAGCIFFALHGENFDGNNFAVDAIHRGAAIAVADNEEAVKKSIEFDDKKLADLVSSGHLVFVGDTLSTLQSLARYHRRTLNIPILAITGSSGKTTTKELIARVLACKFRVQATEGNLNNHIGVPLTLLKLDNTVELAIVEMGASHRHEIEALASIAEPNYGIITNIGKAHLEGFGGQEGVRLGKGELADYLDQTEGTFFYLADEPMLKQTAEEHKNLNAAPYSLDDWEVIEDTYASARNQGTLFTSQLTGSYNIYNIAAATTIGRHFGIDDSRIAQAIASYTPTNNRSQRCEGVRGNIVIRDAYNANPLSMSAAIDAIVSTKDDNRSRVLILGDMRELGEYSDKEHEQILSKVITLINRDIIKRVILVGKCWNSAVQTLRTQELSQAINHTPDACSTLPLAASLSNSLILVKGSRGVGLEELYEYL